MGGLFEKCPKSKIHMMSCDGMWNNKGVLSGKLKSQKRAKLGKTVPNLRDWVLLVINARRGSNAFKGSKTKIFDLE